jgi:uncharacterized protein (UPF0332 family)
VKPETGAYLTNASEALKDASAILAIQIPRQAARLAYYAQFHAAQALIFERTGKIAKTHRGVKTQFHKLAKEEPEIDLSLAADLAASYHFKEAADYETGSENAISAEDAAETIRVAERFVAAVRRALSGTAGKLRFS